VVIKAGILDDPEWLNKNVPKGELFAGKRMKWTPALEGAAQLPGIFVESCRIECSWRSNVCLLLNSSSIIA
jgi:hypothetical protein